MSFRSRVHVTENFLLIETLSVRIANVLTTPFTGYFHFSRITLLLVTIVEQNMKMKKTWYREKYIYIYIE